MLICSMSASIAPSVIGSISASAKTEPFAVMVVPSVKRKTSTSLVKGEKAFSIAAKGSRDISLQSAIKYNYYSLLLFVDTEKGAARRPSPWVVWMSL